MSPLNSTTPLRPGQAVFYGRYSLVRPIGHGGMAVVWLALDRKLGVHRALKFLRGIDDEPEVEWGLLQREAARVRCLDHENIVRVYDCLRSMDLGALSMEYIDGVTLEQLQGYQPGRRFKVDDLRPWMAQLCDALGYAHGLGIVHLDLKPANVMVNSRAQLKVTDFGIARRLAEPASTSEGPGGIRGTPAFMSPQRLAMQPPCLADDVFAFGATLFALLSGHAPPRDSHLSLPRIRAGSRVPSMEPVPPAWERLIRSCLEERPEYRPRHFGEIAAALDLEVPGHRPTPLLPALDLSILEVQSSLRDQDGLSAGGDEEPEEARTVLIRPPGNPVVASAGRVILAAAAALAMLGGFLMTKLVNAHRAEPEPVAATPSRGPATPVYPLRAVERLEEMNASLRALEKAVDAPGAQTDPIVRFLDGRTFTETVEPFAKEIASGHDPGLSEKLATIYVSRAHLQVKLSRVSQALQDLKQALEIYPCFPPALELHGKLTHHADVDGLAGCIG